MPGPTYGLSKKEVKKARKVSRSTGRAPAAAAQTVTSQRTRTVSSYPSGTRRKIKQEFKQARQARSTLSKYGLSVDTFSGSLSPGEAEFVAAVSRGTGLDKKVIAAWTKLEGGNATGDYNRLNIGHTDSGPLAFTSGSVWANPKSAARETVAFLRGQKYGASPQIQAILPRARGRSPQEQIAVITSSGWATDPAYAQKVSSVYSQIGPSDGLGNSPKVRAARRQLRSSRKSLEGLGVLKIKAKKPATIVRIGKIAQKRFGLRVSENAAFDGGVTPTGGHAENSYHYSNAAIDVSGDPAKMLAFDQFVARKYGKDLEELFYDPGVSIDNGQVTGSIGGHSDHVHVAETTGAKAGLTGALPSSGGVFDFSAPSGDSSSPFDTKPLGNRKLTPAEQRIKRRRNRILSSHAPTSFTSTVPTLSIPSSTVKAPKLDL